MSEQIRVQCGIADRNGKRAVVATLGGRQQVDKFDVASAYHRSRFCERVVDRFQLSPDAHE